MRIKLLRRLAGWGLVVLALGAVGWLWWRAAHGEGERQPAGQKSVAVAKATTPVAPGRATNRIAPPNPAPAMIPVKNPEPAPVRPGPGEGQERGSRSPDLRSPVPAGESPGEADYPRPVRTVFEAQVALGRQALSCGSIDGLNGPQTRAAIRAFQQREGLPLTGELDAATKEGLVLTTAACSPYTLTAEDLGRLQPLSPTWAGKAQQTALEYETVLEFAAEKSQSHPKLLRQLNPGITWTNLTAGATLQLPDVARPEPPPRAAFLVIHLADRSLEAFDGETNLLAHFPCSIARQVEKRPVGELHVVGIAPNPNYTFDPAVFPESPEAQQLGHKLVLPPGPNNPVGTAWISLDKPGYGIHGTPNPEQVGRTESHGCFRLANWNAEYLLRSVSMGTPVYVEP